MYGFDDGFVHEILYHLYPERNRIHCLLDRVRAFGVNEHINEWTRIRDYCVAMVQYDRKGLQA